MEQKRKIIKKVSTEWKEIGRLVGLDEPDSKSLNNQTSMSTVFVFSATGSTMMATHPSIPSAGRGSMTSCMTLITRL